MAGSIGLGLLLNVLFWTVVVLAAAGLACLAAIAYFPGREGSRRKPRASPRVDEVGHRGPEEDEEPERYWKAS